MNSTIEKCLGNQRYGHVQHIMVIEVEISGYRCPRHSALVNKELVNRVEELEAYCLTLIGLETCEDDYQMASIIVEEVEDAPQSHIE